MRESEFRIFQARNARREMLVLNQYEFIESRQRALELVLGGLSIWDRIAMLMGRKSLKEAVDEAHIRLFREVQAEREEMVKRAKEEARKPKIIVPGTNGVNHG